MRKVEKEKIFEALVALEKRNHSERIKIGIRVNKEKLKKEGK